MAFRQKQIDIFVVYIGVLLKSIIYVLRVTWS